jgi:hypothetical protein
VAWEWPRQLRHHTSLANQLGLAVGADGLAIFGLSRVGEPCAIQGALQVARAVEYSRGRLNAVKEQFTHSEGQLTAVYGQLKEAEAGAR